MQKKKKKIYTSFYARETEENKVNEIYLLSNSNFPLREEFTLCSLENSNEKTSSCVSCVFYA